MFLCGLDVHNRILDTHMYIQNTRKTGLTGTYTHKNTCKYFFLIQLNMFAEFKNSAKPCPLPNSKTRQRFDDTCHGCRSSRSACVIILPSSLYFALGKDFCRLRVKKKNTAKKTLLSPVQPSPFCRVLNSAKSFYVDFRLRRVF